MWVFLMVIQLLSYSCQIAQQPATCMILPPTSIIIFPKKYVRALDPRTRKKLSTSFVSKRSGTLFSPLSSCSWMSFVTFMFLTLGFYMFSRKNLCYVCYNDVYGWHTTQRRYPNDFWWVGGTKLTFVNLILMKRTFPQNFPPTLHVTDN